MPFSDLWKAKPMDSDSKYLRAIDIIWVVVNRINVFFLILWVIMFIIVLLTARGISSSSAPPQTQTV